MAVIEIDSDKIVAADAIAAAYIEEAYAGSQLVILLKNGKEIVVHSRDRRLHQTSIWELHRKIKEALS